MADPNTFLQVPGIDGDASEPNHTGWIELLSVDVKEQRPPSRDGTIPAEYDVIVDKQADKASQSLAIAYRNAKHFDSIVIDTVSPSGTVRQTFKNVVIASHSTRSGDPPTVSITFSCSERIIEFKEPKRGGLNDSDPSGSNDSQSGFELKKQPEVGVQLKKKPAVTRAVVRANMAAVNEHSTINLRPTRFFELALPVLTDEHGQRTYPPADATLRLTSAKGYNRTQPISAGMVTDDQFCSFRFADISEKQADQLFTATLEWNDQKETIFQDRRIATYIQSARKTGEYETAFPSGVDDSSSADHDDMLAPVSGEPTEA